MNIGLINKILYLLFLIILCLILFGIIIYLEDNPPKKEQFTEIYFTNHTSLPTKMIIGKQYNISFTIVPHEKCIYEYSLNYSGDVLSTGELIIPENENKTIQYQFIPNKTSEINKFTITLKCKNKIYDIYFWASTEP